MIQQDQQVLPIGLGTIELVDKDGHVTGGGQVFQALDGTIRQVWILGPGYTGLPPATVTFRGAKEQLGSAEEWLAVAGPGLWSEGARYVESRVLANADIHESFREHVMKASRRMKGYEQKEFRNVSLLFSVETVSGAIFVPDIWKHEAGSNEALMSKSATAGSLLWTATEYWLMSDGYTAPPSGTTTFGSPTRWGGPAVGAPISTHAAYFDSLVAMAGKSGRLAAVECAAFSALP